MEPRGRVLLAAFVVTFLVVIAVVALAIAIRTPECDPRGCDWGGVPALIRPNPVND